MKRGNSVYKIPQGKLLKVSLDYDEQAMQIREVSLTGDFFIYPEASLQLIESVLSHVPLRREAIIGAVMGVLQCNDIQLFGLSVEGIADGIMFCLEEKTV